MNVNVKGAEAHNDAFAGDRYALWTVLNDKNLMPQMEPYFHTVIYIYIYIHTHTHTHTHTEYIYMLLH